MLSERIDATLETPLYMQVIHALIHEIQRGRLLPGASLPSSRQLAQILGVNRKTVVLAYEDLIAQGWLTSLGTRGTVVSPSLPDVGARSAQVKFGEHATSAAVAQYQFKNAGAMQPLMTSQWLKLDEGSPDGRLFPAEALVRTYRAAIYRASRENRLSYADPRGSLLLREAIATMLRTHAGVYDEGNGETDDAIAVLDWALQRWPGAQAWLGGFSFGGAIAIRTASARDVRGLVTVAPAIRRVSVDTNRLPRKPWLIVQGDSDELVDAADIQRWAQTLPSPPEVVLLHGVEHFFHGRLNELRDIVVDWLRKQEGIRT